MNYTFSKDFHRSIVFSNVPLSGIYKFKEIFQIIPGSKEWPSLQKGLFSNLPIILEYQSNYHIHHLLAGTIRSIQNVDHKRLTESFRHLDFKKELLALMTLVSNANFYVENYFLSREKLGKDYFAEKFIEPKNPKMNLQDMGALYSREYTLGDTLSLPDNIDSILDKYFTLEGDLFIRYRMSLMLFFNSISINSISPSMCFVALISSIENLVDVEGEINKIKYENCETCSQVKYKVSRRFKDFLIHYVEQDSIDFIRFLNKIYTTRSNITHIGELLYNDFADTDIDFSSLNMLNTLKKVVRVALVNWLLAR